MLICISFVIKLVTVRSTACWTCGLDPIINGTIIAKSAGLTFITDFTISWYNFFRWASVRSCLIISPTGLKSE
jgi:hypothetical protein